MSRDVKFDEYQSWNWETTGKEIYIPFDGEGEKRVLSPITLDDDLGHNELSSSVCKTRDI